MKNISAYKSKYFFYNYYCFASEINLGDVPVRVTSVILLQFLSNLHLHLNALASVLVKCL